MSMASEFDAPPMFHVLLIFSLLILSVPASGLSTNGRWIVDEDGSMGKRVKLACVNWPSHLETMLAEGLSKQSLHTIVQSIQAMGFNCVRLTWPTFLPTNDSLAQTTVRQNFLSLGLLQDVNLIHLHNPTLLDLPLIQAFKVVVTTLGDNNIMVILDNHLSKPGWCCGRTDGNGFFGDTYFDPNLWKEGLSTMATHFRGVPNVIGMSLRNELRGPRQNIEDWFRYMQEGAEVVHAANKDVLVILSGLSYDNDLAFLASRKVNLSFDHKLVFEVHWYAFSDGNAWVNGNPNDVCGWTTQNVMRRAGFLLDQQYPLFLSEFGLDQRGGDVNGDRYFSCVLAFAAEKDLDWALWSLQGNYYFREGVVGMEEFYGVLSYDWGSHRNNTMLRRIQSIQNSFQDPSFSQHQRHPYKLLYHPQTGLCVSVSNSDDLQLVLVPCIESRLWEYTINKTLSVVGALNSQCVIAQGLGQQVTLEYCNMWSSTWHLLSASKMHMVTYLTNNGTDAFCWDVGTDSKSIVTNLCSCLGGDSSCDSEGQWFKMVTSDRAPTN